MASSPPTANDIRQIVREELEPVASRMRQGFDRVDKQIEDLDRKLTGRFDRLEEMLEGVIDKDYPPVDQQRPSGGPSGITGMAAKGP